MGRALAALTLLLLALPAPAPGAIPESPGVINPIPDAPTFPASLNTVIELLRKGDSAGGLKAAREFVRS